MEAKATVVAIAVEGLVEATTAIPPVLASPPGGR